MTAISHPKVPTAAFVPAGVARRVGLIGALAVLALALAVIVISAARAPAPLLNTRPPAQDVPTRASAPSASGQAIARPAPADYIVGPGDTIWSIARSLHPEGDLRSTVDRLVALNGGAALKVGQRFRLR